MLDEKEVQHWLALLVEKLQQGFGERLLLVVHVGSWARHDANAQSDVDLNVVLDKVAPDDIITYRKMIETMPERQMACGFLGGAEEMKLWPKWELPAFYYGCQVLYGNVAEVIGPVSRKDIFDHIMIQVSGINHAVRHAMIYDEDLEEAATSMKGLYKAAFFVIQGWYLLKYGEYVGKRSELLNKSIFPDDLIVLHRFALWHDQEAERRGNPMETLALLEGWSSAMFQRMAELAAQE